MSIKVKIKSAIEGFIELCRKDTFDIHSINKNAHHPQLHLLDTHTDVTVPTPVGGEALIYNGVSSKWESKALTGVGGGGATTFTALTDTPVDYAGHAGKLVKVDPTGTFLIFGDPSGSTVSWGDIQGTLLMQTDLLVMLNNKSNTAHRHNGIDGSGAVNYADLTNKPVIPVAQTFNHIDLTDITEDQHHPKIHNYNTHTGIPTEFPPEAHVHAHNTLTGIAADDHHAQLHAHDGSDGSGRVGYGDLTGVPVIPPLQTFLHDNLTDVSINQHHNKTHSHDGLDGSGQVDYSNLTSKPVIPAAQTFNHADLVDISQDQHHSKNHAHNSTDGSGQIDYSDILNTPAGIPSTGIPWATHPISGGWSASVPFEYMLDTAGNVHILGRITGGTLGTVFYIFPVNMRPKGNMWFMCNVSGYKRQATILIDKAGNMSVHSASNTQSAIKYTEISGITFHVG